MAAVALPTATAYEDGDSNPYEVWEVSELDADFIRFCQTVAQAEPGQYVVVEDDSSSIGAVFIVDDPANAGLTLSS